MTNTQTPKIGDLALLHLSGTESVRAVWAKCSFGHRPSPHWCFIPGEEAVTTGWTSEDHEARTDLITLQLPEGALSGWPTLINALDVAAKETGLKATFGGLIRQVKEQTEEPRIPEPGTWGVVSAKWDARHEPEDWVRLHDGKWCPLLPESRIPALPWDDLIDPVLIREGA